MTNERLLMKLNDMLHAKDEMTRVEIIRNLIPEVEEEIRKETAKSCGQGNLYRTARDILKVAASDEKESIKYAHTENGFQYICDGYRLLKISKPLPLSELPMHIIPPDYERLISGFKSFRPVKIELPDPAKLKAYIKIKSVRKGTDTVYDFGEGLPVVSAKYLLSMIEAFPDATAEVEHSDEIGNKHPIHFRAENGDFGLLLPLNPKQYTNPRGKTNLEE